MIFGSFFITVFVQKPKIESKATILLFYDLAITVATLIYLDFSLHSAFMHTKTHTKTLAHFQRGVILSHRAASIDRKRFSGSALIELKEEISPLYCLN